MRKRLLASVSAIALLVHISGARAQWVSPKTIIPAPWVGSGGAMLTAPSALTPGSTPAVNASLSNNFTDALGQNQTIANPTSVTAGEWINFQFAQPASGGTYNYTVAFNTDYLNQTGGQFKLTTNTGASAITEVGCYVATTGPVLYCYGPLNGAGTQTLVSAPVAASSTSLYTMQGLTGSITPAVTGKVLFLFTATVTSSTTTVGVGVQCQISYGTSTAPVNNAALTGTQVGNVGISRNESTVTAVDTDRGMAMTALVSGLTIGTAYWDDVACEALTTASEAPLVNVNITAVELR